MRGAPRPANFAAHCYSRARALQIGRPESWCSCLVTDTFGNAFEVLRNSSVRRRAHIPRRRRCSLHSVLPPPPLLPPLCWSRRCC